MEIYSFINTLKKYGFSCRCDHIINNRMRSGFSIKTRALAGTEEREREKKYADMDKKRHKKSFFSVRNYSNI